ncbi:Transcriptional regulator, contains XRE-family HTH domain [Paenibacillus uliginis N3/975]|uniref:Transcriptional regulator, contains XRE-family HTH domain n=1 Tax=Paenibacillus uliginis N3/975 TaxID=1313296 RepID=A0A1X7GRR0_9BACL|nr:helix-turn-helix transcriptional regulator [Paenibacillus uliginis]SMF73745.1 Transcriptional regulator, contains XRE-family HTH domain [Paenibacillus uliginis N3/975]
MQSIYQRIEHLIESRGMTKKAFCENLGISTGNFGDWKRGKTTPSTNKLIEIAGYFEVSLDWLIVGRGSPSPGVMEVRENYGANHKQETAEQIQASNLTDDEKDFIREYLEFTEYRKHRDRE